MELNKNGSRFLIMTYMQNIKLLILAIIILVSCTKEEIKEPNESILVKIGDKSISVSEFIRRAEYTIRPPYCRGSHNLDKKIVLNSLIAEKLMAIEATDTNSFIMHDNVKAYLRGRKEQSMRQWLYEKEGREKVVLDTLKIMKTVKAAGRKYKVSYFSIQDSAFVFEMSKEIEKKNQSFEDVYFEVTGLDSLPKKEVEWSEIEHQVVLDSLYSDLLKKDQVLGPLKVAKDEYMMIKVNGWIDRVAITQQQIQERWKRISDEVIKRKSLAYYDKYIMKVMKGKEIEFFPDAFYKIVDLLGPQYLQTDEEKKAKLNEQFWDKYSDDEKVQDIQAQMKMLAQEPVFKVSDQVWTVQDFSDELIAHPLVFRQKKIKNIDFGQQLQFAIMDMIRDKYLSEEAYDRGYDKINVIQRTVGMWKDNLNYNNYKTNFLKGVLPDTLTEMPYIPLLENYLNPKVDSLQKKYSNLVELDVDAFNEIKLTRIDLSVVQQNVPFVKVVPSFPIITMDNKLDYGSKLNKKEEKLK